jgi:hypothetical protein
MAADKWQGAHKSEALSSNQIACPSKFHASLSPPIEIGNFYLKSRVENVGARHFRLAHMNLTSTYFPLERRSDCGATHWIIRALAKPARIGRLPSLVSGGSDCDRPIKKEAKYGSRVSGWCTQ